MNEAVWSMELYLYSNRAFVKDEPSPSREPFSYGIYHQTESSSVRVMGVPGDNDIKKTLFIVLLRCLIRLQTRIRMILTSFISLVIKV
jgi:hypothetical protein